MRTICTIVNANLLIFVLLVTTIVCRDETVGGSTVDKSRRVNMWDYDDRPSDYGRSLREYDRRYRSRQLLLFGGQQSQQQQQIEQQGTERQHDKGSDYGSLSSSTEHNIHYRSRQLLLERQHIRQQKQQLLPRQQRQQQQHEEKQQQHQEKQELQLEKQEQQKTQQEKHEQQQWQQQQERQQRKHDDKENNDYGRLLSLEYDRNQRKIGRRHRSRRWLFSRKQQPHQQQQQNEYGSPPSPDLTQQNTAADSAAHQPFHLQQRQRSQPQQQHPPEEYGSTKLVDEELDRQQLEDFHRRQEARAQKSAKLDYGSRRLQGVGVRGRLMCGRAPLNATKVKLVDVDPRPDRDDLMAETRTDAQGLFHLSGATREEGEIEVIIKVYHDCLDEHVDCQRKATWRVPPRYHNNGTLVEWFDIGTVNMELIFGDEERDCRH